MSIVKKTKQESLRQSAARTREASIAELSPDDLSIYSRILKGEQDAFYQGQKAKLGTPLYDATAYLQADYLDLMDAIKNLNAEPAAPGGAPAMPPGMFPGLPGMSATNPTPSAPAPVIATTMADVGELLDAWITRYGIPAGNFEADFIRSALRARSKELLSDLMTRDIFKVDSMQETRYRQEGKIYATRDGYDVKKTPLRDALLTSQVTVLLEVAVEHPVGRDMIKASDEAVQYKALQFAFDTKNRVVLEGLIDAGVNVTDLYDPEHRSPLLCDFMYRAEEDDVENLRFLVQKGASITAMDPMHSTPLMVAGRMGNLAGLRFLMEFDTNDIYAKNTMGDTVLSIVEAGPSRRAQEQEDYDDSLVRFEESHLEKIQAWEVQVKAAEAAGKKPPDEPKKPQLKPRPDDYPLEAVSLIQDAWAAGDPTQSPQALAIQALDTPHEFSMDFDSDI